MSGSSRIDVLDDGLLVAEGLDKPDNSKGMISKSEKRWRSAGAGLRRINLTVTARIRQ